MRVELDDNGRCMCPDCSDAQAKLATKVLKAPLSHILRFPAACKGLAEMLEYGDKKYGDFKIGTLTLPPNKVADALLRHLSALLNGERIDPESGKPHSAHILANALFLAEIDLTKGDKPNA